MWAVEVTYGRSAKRALDVISTLFGAKDERLPASRRGGMVASIRWFMSFEHSLRSR